MAKKVLAKHDVKKAPTPIEKIASAYAELVWENMPDDISGMLIPAAAPSGDLKWVIVVNKHHAEVRQRFTIAHELGHILLHKYTSPHADGRVRVRFRDDDSSRGSDFEEIEANGFAAELLMPERIIRSLTARINFDPTDGKDDRKAVFAMTRLAHRFEVSVQALSFRMANLGSFEMA
jgi:Zn-dependent peptidase ImmA (M78 family)